MSLKTENSRRIAKSRPVCMGLKLWWKKFKGTNSYNVLKEEMKQYFLQIKILYKIIRSSHFIDILT